MSTLPAEISQKVPNPLLHNLGVVQNMEAPRLKAKVKMPLPTGRQAFRHSVTSIVLSSYPCPLTLDAKRYGLPNRDLLIIFNMVCACLR
jgi:hypothetical protein